MFASKQTSAIEPAGITSEEASAALKSSSASATLNSETNSAEQPLVVIEPASPWRVADVKELWRHRELFYTLAWRDISVRYKQTVLGAAWAALQPAAMMLVFTVFFGRLAHVPHSNVPYPVFVFAGLLPWLFFSTSLTAAANSVVGSERLISKIYFPRLLIPYAAVGAALVDSLIALLGLAILMTYYGIVPTYTILLAPLLLASIALAALGFGTCLAALTVRYRDFKHIIPFLMQLWLFATPSVYMATSGHKEATAHGSPEKLLDHTIRFFQYALEANPMTPLIASFRATLMGTPLPTSSLVFSVATVIVVFLLGSLYFRSVEDSFADMI